jgi:hypothetical protein
MGFPVTAAGYADLVGWLEKFGDLALVGSPAATGPAWSVAGHGCRLVVRIYNGD